METQEKVDVTAYLENLGLSITSEQDWNPDTFGWTDQMNHYRVTLKMGRRRMSFWFYQGKGIKDAPKLERVIENLACDRTYAQMTEREFGDELGWTHDTHASYTLLKRLNARYERLIGSPALLDEIYEKVTA